MECLATTQILPYYEKQKKHQFDICFKVFTVNAMKQTNLMKTFTQKERVHTPCLSKFLSSKKLSRVSHQTFTPILPVKTNIF